MRRAAVVSFVVGVCVRGIAWAAAGDLDPSFGTGGAVVAALSASDDEGDVVAVQPDGMILVGGKRSQAFVARFDASGVLDPSFGSGGIVDLVDPSNVAAMVLDPDGKIIVMGPSGGGMLLTRLLPNGTVDTTFGVAGIADPGIDVGFDRAGGLLLQPDLKIVAGGSGANDDFALVRFLPNGTIDSAFGAFGVAEASPGTDGSSELFDVVLQADGKLVAGGVASSNGHEDFALARFTVSGALDPTFGTGGTKTQAIFGANTDEGIVALGLQSDGKIVAVGNPRGGPSAFMVARFKTSGALDTTFGFSGIQVFGIAGSDFSEDVVIAPSDRIILAGESQGLLTLARIGADGLLDDTFGPNANGIARYGSAPLSPCCSHLHGVALQPDGRIVAAGYTAPNYFTTGFDLALIRVFGGECGNAVQEPGEDCELPSSCCTSSCTFESAGAACTDDGLTCTRDVCDATGGCTHPANVRPGCATSSVAGGTTLTIRDDPNDARDALVWRWGKAPSFPPGAFGDPIGSTSYALCGFSGSSLLFQLDAPAGGTCAGQPCWRARGTSGFGYRDPAATPSGTTVLSIGGTTTRAKLKGKGANLSIAPLPLASPVRVQLQATNGFCVDGTFSQPLRSDARHFRAKSD